MNVQFRNRTEAPTEPGLYWARRKGHIPWDIRPVLLYDRRVFRFGNPVAGTLDQFEWFGPVDIVKEG